MKNRKNNKGFSLVELIVVVAIMAVLVGVLAPTYLKYVEKTRVQKDVTAVGEFVQAIKVAAADETINTWLADADNSASYTIGADVYKDQTDVLTGELKTTIESIELGSNTITGVTVTADIVSGNLQIVVNATTTETGDTKPIEAELEAIGTTAPQN